MAGFDLAPWGVAGGDCVALLIGNGVQLGVLLLSTMYRYVALPIDAALPPDAVEAELCDRRANALVVIAGTDAARKARAISPKMAGLVIIELTQGKAHPIAVLPPPPDGAAPPAETPALGPDDRVLLLHTSGTTGTPKYVGYTLSRLILAGSGIAQSLDGADASRRAIGSLLIQALAVRRSAPAIKHLQRTALRAADEERPDLSPADVGISMLPLHHVGGLACNLIAPMVAGASMLFSRAFDPKVFFDALAGEQGASWCYLVPTLWSMLVEYVEEHPELRKDKPWPRLRVLRSAGSDLPHELALRLSDIFGSSVAVLPTYGMTEAMPIASPGLTYRLERPGSVGRALPPLAIEIVDFSEGENCAPVTGGSFGEITVTGPTVLPQYEDDVAVGTSLFTPRGYFRTGDLGRLDADGWLYLRVGAEITSHYSGQTYQPTRRLLPH